MSGNFRQNPEEAMTWLEVFAALFAAARSFIALNLGSIVLFVCIWALSTFALFILANYSVSFREILQTAQRLSAMNIVTPLSKTLGGEIATNIYFFGIVVGAICGAVAEIYRQYGTWTAVVSTLVAFAVYEVVGLIATERRRQRRIIATPLLAQLENFSGHLSGTLMVFFEAVSHLVLLGGPSLIFTIAVWFALPLVR
jgi:hypothetical protein